MSEVTFLAGITAGKVQTDRLEVAYLEAGATNPIPVVLVHGNVSCSWFFEDLMLKLAEGGLYHVYAPDMRGYGDSQTLPVDATRGVRDFSDDLASFAQAVGLTRFHLFGWSLGGNVVMQYAIDYPASLRSLVLQAPGSPFGFGGTQGPEGKLNHEDAAGSGGGTANADFVKRLAAADRSDEPGSPRQVMNTFYVKPPFRASSQREETYLSAMLSTKTADGNYPGDMVASAHWPGIGPGVKGPNNAISPKYLNQAEFADLSLKPRVLWLRGDSDQIVGDNSLFDLGTLGQLGAVPGWPGAKIFPSQPMIEQMRTVLDRYQANGGTYTEVVLLDCGHSPHIEKASEVVQHLLEFFGAE